VSRSVPLLDLMELPFILSRLAKGYRPYTGKQYYGCMPFWVINDPGYTPRGAPVDIIYFVEHENGKRTLEVPSLGISLKRVSHSCQVD
jgi:hypothetical protein